MDNTVGTENVADASDQAGLGPTVNAQELFLPNQLDDAFASKDPSIGASQIAIYCPPPSRFFQGRGDILDKMHHFFASNKESRNTYVLHGLGGAGKTQIALKFIKDSASRFSDVFFIDASTTATIERGLKNIAVVKNAGDSSQDGLTWLTHNSEEWLLVFNDTDDLSINLMDFIPGCNHGNIIITSRNPGLCAYSGSNSLVSDLEEKDAVALLLESAAQKATIETEQIAADIVKTLYCFPLAIVQAGAFISKSQNIGSYLEVYAKNPAQLLSEKPAVSNDHYPWSVYTTWQKSFDKLTPPAAMLLQYCSFLYYDGILEGIFSYASAYTFQSYGPSKEELQDALEFLSYFQDPTGEWNSSQFMMAMNEAQAYSLISFDAERKLFYIHPLVHAWSQATVSNPQRYISTIGSILGMAISAWPSQNILLASLILYQHVESAVQNHAKVAPVFKCHFGSILEKAGRYNESQRLLKEALVEQKQLWGDNHPETLLTMGNLAGTYSVLGEYQKAKELNATVLEKQTQLLGDQHPDRLLTMGNLAHIYSNLGEYQKAKELTLTVVEKQKQVLGDSHPNTLSSMSNLAQIYSALGDYTKAEELNVVVLERRKQILGEDHLYTLISMGNLAQIYSAQGHYKKAEELNVVVLEKQMQILGENHPDTLRTMGNLAHIYSVMGEYQKAKELTLTMLEKQKQILGDSHPDTLCTMSNLAHIYSDMGHYKKAKELNVVVLESRKQILGENHPDTLIAMGNLAHIYSNLGEYQEAKKLTLTVLEKREQILGHNHPDTLCTMGNLAHIYSVLGEYQKANELNITVLERRKQLLGDSHPDTLLAMSNLAQTYSALKDYKKAEELNVAVLERQKQILGENHPATLRSMGNLACAYSDLGQYTKAEELTFTVLEKQKQILGDQHPETLHTMSNLARTYSDLGQYTKARELNVVVLEKRKQILGENHPDTLLAMSNLAKSYSNLGRHEEAEKLSMAVVEKQKQLDAQTYTGPGEPRQTQELV